MLGCSKEDHEERARRYPFCFLCGAHIRVSSEMPMLTECPHCKKPAHRDWKWCGWCGGKIQDT